MEWGGGLSSRDSVMKLVFPARCRPRAWVSVFGYETSPLYKSAVLYGDLEGDLNLDNYPFRV